MRVSVQQSVEKLRLGAYPDRDEQLDAAWKAIGVLFETVEDLMADAKPATRDRVKARLENGPGAEGLAMARVIRAVKTRFPKE